MDFLFLGTVSKEIFINAENEIFTENHGCKDRKNINTFYKTTAGIMAMIKPCGIVVQTMDMFTAESLTQAFIFLKKIGFQNNEDYKHISWVGYDRSCELKPFVKKLADSGDEEAKIMMSNWDFLVDIFHVFKHKKTSCMPLNNPNCQFHPHLSKFSKIAGVNTESCEQGFRRLNRYKFMLKKMTRNKRKFVLDEINDDYNVRLEKRLCKA